VIKHVEAVGEPAKAVVRSGKVCNDVRGTGVCRTAG